MTTYTVYLGSNVNGMNGPKPPITVHADYVKFEDRFIEFKAADHKLLKAFAIHTVIRVDREEAPDPTAEVAKLDGKIIAEALQRYVAAGGKLTI